MSKDEHSSKKTAKIRLDIALVEQGLFQSRKEAQTAIMDGAVLVNNEKVTKSGTNVSSKDVIEIRTGFAKQRFVSRGGYKLEKALLAFDVPTRGRTCLDVGASTGGFTDCLLQSGAKKVYSIDVGYGQLDWRLRNDKRVVVVEKTNARYLRNAELYKEGEEPADLAVIDCSFISLTKLIPAVSALLDRSFAQIICLIKPQFEAGRESVNKGVVKDPDVHKHVVKQIIAFGQAQGFSHHGLTYSPLQGPKGNIEYLLVLQRGERGSATQIQGKDFQSSSDTPTLRTDNSMTDVECDIDKVVAEASLAFR